jgi:hypothetical protein
MDECPVCQGRKRIKLPLYQPVSASFSDDADWTAREASREYACPECSGVPESRVNILGCVASIFCPDPVNFPDQIKAMRHHMAREMAEKLVKDGFIRIEVGPVGDDFRSEVTATLGAVSERAVASMEQRIAEHQDVVAREVANAAAAGIRVWGSYYTDDDGSIPKSQAVDAVREALKAVLEKRKPAAAP